MTTQIQAGITQALEAIGHLYEDRAGRQFIGNRVADVLSEMRVNGWKNVSRLDPADHGFKVEEARYKGGVKDKAYAREVVVLKWL